MTPTIFAALVFGRGGGADPTTPKGNGFTIRRSCRFATPLYIKTQVLFEGFEPSKFFLKQKIIIHF